MIAADGIANAALTCSGTSLSTAVTNTRQHTHTLTMAEAPGPSGESAGVC